MFKVIMLLIIFSCSFSQQSITDEINRLYPKYIYKGFVAYGKWSKSKKDLNSVRSLFKEMQAVNIKKLKGNDRKAFYINLYNIAVLNLIFDHFPVASIMKIENAFEKKIIDLGEISYSLNDLEKRVLTPEFSDPRIHFALVCAALSCPHLREFAYEGNKLEEQLEFVTKSFILDQKMNQFNPKEANISKLFEWYLADFGTKNDMISFLNRYIDVRITNKTVFTYNKYSWKLNGELSLRSSR